MKNFLEKAISKLEKLDKKQIEDILKNASEKIDIYESLFESINKAIIVLDLKNKTNYQNKSAKHFLQNANNFKLEKLNHLVEKIINNDKKVENLELDLGESEVISLSVLPFVSGKKVNGNLLIIEEISEQIKERQSLKRLEALETFISHTANIAHEIKNPLGAISLNLQLVKKQIEKLNIENSKIEKYLNVSLFEIARLSRIVTTFLETVKPINLKSNLLDINKLIKYVSSTLYEEIKKNKIELTLKLNAKSKIYVDEDLIKQVLINIIKNAQESLRELPSNERRVIEIETYEREDFLHIKIKDNGMGIPKELHEKIFKPQFTTKTGGSGIGLTISYKIIKEHNGELYVKNERERGVSFIILLPIISGRKLLIES